MSNASRDTTDTVNLVFVDEPLLSLQSWRL